MEFLDGGLVLALIRMVKTDHAEVGLLTTAARKNKRARQEPQARKYRNPRERASREIHAGIAREGAVFDHYFYSPDGLWLSGAQGYRLRRGEYTIIDSGCTFQLYFGDMGTTLLVGKERPDVVKRYKEVWEAIDEVADHAEAGMTPADVMGMFANLYRKKNIPNPDYQGHGIGLEPREYPIMGQGGPKTVGDDVASLSTEIPLEVGMVVSLETSILRGRRGLVRGREDLRDRQVVAQGTHHEEGPRNLRERALGRQDYLHAAGALAREVYPASFVLSSGKRCEMIEARSVWQRVKNSIVLGEHPRAPLRPLHCQSLRYQSFSI